VVAVLAVCAAVLGASSPALAADKAKKKAAPDTAAVFKKLDGNSDGKLSLEEFKNLFTVMDQPKLGKKEPPIDLAAVFKALAKSDEKALTPEEFKGVTAALPQGKKKAK
jgi:hypothetical protein